MGRGRAKAKQTKVARELKYMTPDTDLSALERELHASKGSEYDDIAARYNDVPDEDEGDDDYGRWVAGGGR